MSSDEYALPGTILRYFDLTASPYGGGAAEDIQAKRKAAPGGKLFFDRLLEFASIDGESVVASRGGLGSKSIDVYVCGSELASLAMARSSSLRLAQQC